MSAPPTTVAAPVLYWDQDCDFCRRWVERWHADTGDAVTYRTFAEAPPDVVAAAGGLPPRHIVLAQPDGTMLVAARAAFAALSTATTEGKLLDWAARSVPGFGWFADRGYAWVANHRGWCNRLTTLAWGRSTLRPAYRVSGWMFPRLVGLVYLAAFLSLWVQIDGLAGSKGVLPLGAQMAAIAENFGAAGRMPEAWWQMPSLLWFGSTDAALHTWLAVGVLASAAMVAGLAPGWAALLAWVCYLSFATAVPVFLNYQWDTLLLETGLLTLLWAPWCWRQERGAAEPPRLARWLVWWLLFRLMLESGVVKLLGFDQAGYNAWLQGTALDYHYFTQPVPLWTSWWFAQLPGWFNRLSLVVVFVIELVLPFFIFGPRRVRMTAFAGFVLLQALIIASGHYGFFNLLTIVLCVSLVDDASWPRRLRAWLERPPTAVPARPSNRARRAVTAALAVALFVVTGLQLLAVLQVVRFEAIRPVVSWIAPLRSANAYGLFSVMTTERPEITIEGSVDGQTWEAFEFRYKADADKAPPSIFLPHMPRLDWQMWFAALEFHASGRLPDWLLPLLGKLQAGEPAVTRLLAKDPFGAERPEYLRVRLDLLTFAPPGTNGTPSPYWNRTPLPEYTVQGRLERNGR